MRIWLALVVLALMHLVHHQVGGQQEDELHLPEIAYMQMARNMRMRLLEPLCPRGQYIVQGVCRYPLIG